MANKVAFGLNNFHYAIVTEEDGNITYGTPVRHPGAVSLTLDPKGETADFFADDIVYYTSSANQGYDATIELALITEEFRTDVLGEITSGEGGLLVENANAKSKKIAIMFEFDGDEKATRHCLLYCTVNRPGLSGNTKTESTEPETTELVMVASPRPTDLNVKVSTVSTTSEETYNAFYTAVWTGLGA